LSSPHRRKPSSKHPSGGTVEIVVLTPWEASEAVENYLLESGALGTSVQKTHQSSPTETVHGYFPADINEERLEASLRSYLKAIEAYVPAPAVWQISIRSLPDQDWQQVWRAFFKTKKVTQRLVIKPTWESYTPEVEESVIEIDPGMAFGTGLHPTTRLCLKAIEREIDPNRRKSRGSGNHMVSMLDVGTGSGILAIGGAKLGARPVVGIDVDTTAVRVARENVHRNRVEQAVTIRNESLETLDGVFHVVVANIDMKALTALKAPLISHLHHGGRLILSGILKEERQRLEGVFQDLELEMAGDTTMRDWCCLEFKKLR
jgi:ribosomal protein L11 methyltransferase